MLSELDLIRLRVQKNLKVLRREVLNRQFDKMAI